MNSKTPTAKDLASPEYWLAFEHDGQSAAVSSSTARHVLRWVLDEVDRLGQHSGDPLRQGLMLIDIVASIRAALGDEK